MTLPKKIRKLEEIYRGLLYMDRRNRRFLDRIDSQRADRIDRQLASFVA
jgi:hypothetical protein